MGHIHEPRLRPSAERGAVVTQSRDPFSDYLKFRKPHALALEGTGWGGVGRYIWVAIHETWQ